MMLRAPTPLINSTYSCARLISALLLLACSITITITITKARLESQGLPSFRKIAKGLGGKELVFLWLRKTLDSAEFITEIQVTHADPDNAGCVYTCLVKFT